MSLNKHLLTINLEEFVTETTEGLLGITPNYNSQFEHWVAKLLEELEAHQSSENFTEEEFEKAEEVKGLFE